MDFEGWVVFGGWVVLGVKWFLGSGWFLGSRWSLEGVGRWVVEGLWDGFGKFWGFENVFNCVVLLILNRCMLLNYSFWRAVSCCVSYSERLCCCIVASKLYGVYATIIIFVFVLYCIVLYCIVYILKNFMVLKNCMVFYCLY